MELIRAGPRDQNDVRAAAASRLRIVQASLHFELRNRFRRRSENPVRAHSVVAGAIGVDVHGVHAVDGDGVRSGARARGRNQLRAAPQGAGVVQGGRRAGRKRQQLGKVAAREGKLTDRCSLHHATCRRGLRLQQGSCGVGNLDPFRGARRLQHGVNRDALGHPQSGLLDHGGESGIRDLNLVLARHKERKGVCTRAAGLCFPPVPAGLVLRRHMRSHHHRAARILHSSRDGARGLPERRHGDR